MKKFLLITFVAGFLFAFNMQLGKKYSCETVGISFKEGNQTRNIPLNDKTKEDLKKALGDLFTLNAELVKKDELKLTANDKYEELSFKGTWKDYKQYINKDGSILFMPDKNATNNGAALFVIPKKLLIFYECK